jgi:amino-acid N-acetyltransferase
MDDLVPEAERAFYVEEFAGTTIVVALHDPDDETVAGARRTAQALSTGGSRLVLVVGGPDGTLERMAARFDGTPQRAGLEPGGSDERWLADLWLTLTDAGVVLVSAPAGAEAHAAARLAVDLRAQKLVLTDPAGGWGRPPRSFADVVTHAEAYRSQLAERQGGAVVAAIDLALAGGVTNVNLCRGVDLDRELFTFDGAGTLFTSGGYVELGDLRVDDLPAVERLVAQGIAEGLLRDRSRQEIARLAVNGLGARVVGSGHLAGIVSLDVEPYRDEAMGEVSCLTTVSRFSGAGAGVLLLDGLVDRARQRGLDAVFAVTVSEAAAAFFVRRGFREVGHDEIPAAKWVGYAPERRHLARALRRDVHAPGDQGTLGF